MKLRTTLLLVAGILMVNIAVASTTTTTLNVSATIGAGTCSASSSPVAFQIPGSANFNDTNTYYFGNGSIDITCSNGTPYTIDLDGGQHLSFDGIHYNPFVVDGNGNGMLYALFSDPSYNTEWGGANYGAGPNVSGVGNGNPQTYTVYGEINPGFHVGTPITGVSYNDIITVTVNY